MQSQPFDRQYTYRNSSADPDPFRLREIRAKKQLSPQSSPKRKVKSKPSSKPVPAISTIDAIRNFFSSESNEQYFDNWQVAIACLNAEPSTLFKSSFNFWCYQNISLFDPGGRATLFPGGFEWYRKTKCVCALRLWNDGAFHIPIDDNLLIKVLDPTPLFDKFKRLGLH